MRQEFDGRMDARAAEPVPPGPIARGRERRRIDRNHIAQVAAGALALLALSHIPFSRLVFANVPGGRGDARPFPEMHERMQRPAYAICEYHQQIDCVVDATTFWRSGVKYRVAGIDPPDPFSAECNHERDMSRTAMWSLVSALNDRGPVRIAVTGAALPGNLGRPVDVTLKDGGSLADALVRQQAARRTGAANPWCDVVDDPAAPPAASRRAGRFDVAPLAPSPR